MTDMRFTPTQSIIIFISLMIIAYTIIQRCNSWSDVVKEFTFLFKILVISIIVISSISFLMKVTQ